MKNTHNNQPPRSATIHAQSEVQRFWYLLSLLGLYRFLIAVGLLALSPFLSNLKVLGGQWPDLYLGAAAGYLILAVFWVLVARYFQQAFLMQVYFQFLTDLVFLTALMHASGGSKSGVAILLVISIAVNGMLVSGLTAYFFAALSAITLLAEATYSSLIRISSIDSIAASGALGIVFFGIAFLVNILNRRAEESETLASQRYAAISHLKRLNELIVDQSQNGVLVVDLDRKIKLINHRARDLFDIHPTFQNLSLIDFSEALDDAFTQWQLDETVTTINLSQLGSAYDMQANFLALRDSENDVLITLTDVSSLAKVLQNQKLASLGRLTASVAHEIRNPLSAINHAAQLLEESPKLPNDDKRLTHIITQQVVRMDNMVQSILQLSKRGHAKPTHINLIEWLPKFIEEFKFENHSEAAEISLKCEDEAWIECDEGHLRQIMDNICRNSIKYGKTPDGTCTITLWVTQTKQPLPITDIHISDAGSGIDAAAQSDIFEPFHTSSSDSPGLGLYICHELARLNNIQLSYHPAQNNQAHYFKLQCRPPLTH